MGFQRKRPAWWKDEHTGRWERVKEAVLRDWQQTKHDLHVGGHELNQTLKDTVKQAKGDQPMPPIDRPNPPKVIGDAEDWQVMEEPIRFGYGARVQYGVRHPRWNDEIEGVLRQDWNLMRGEGDRSWDEVKLGVRHGYDFEERKTQKTTQADRPSQGSTPR